MFFSIVLGFSKEFIIVLLSFLFHELGHFLFLYLFKYKIKSISVYPFGGVIDYLNKPDFLYRYFFISVGGILVNSILFIFGCIFKLDILMDVNLLFILINLIPIHPLDGSKILLFALKLLVPYYYCKRLIYFISITLTFASFFVIFCFYSGHILILFLCMFLYFL